MIGIGSTTSQLCWSDLGKKDFKMRLFITKRLVVRFLIPEDLPGLTDILSDPEIMKHSLHGVCDEKQLASSLFTA